MSRNPSEITVILREAMLDVLRTATEPMTAAEIGADVRVHELQLHPSAPSQHLARMWKSRRRYKIARIPGRNGYAYYDPAVVKLAPAPKSKAPAAKSEAPAAEPVNPVKSGGFEFNPVEFTAPASEAPSVSVPQGVKSVTITVGGVVVRIDVNA